MSESVLDRRCNKREAIPPRLAINTSFVDKRWQAFVISNILRVKKPQSTITFNKITKYQTKEWVHYAALNRRIQLSELYILQDKTTLADLNQD